MKCGIENCPNDVVGRKLLRIQGEITDASEFTHLMPVTTIEVPVCSEHREWPEDSHLIIDRAELREVSFEAAHDQSAD